MEGIELPVLRSFLKRPAGDTRTGTVGYSFPIREQQRTVAPRECCRSSRAARCTIAAALPGGKSTAARAVSDTSCSSSRAHGRPGVGRSHLGELDREHLPDDGEIGAIALPESDHATRFGAGDLSLIRRTG